MEQDHVEQYLVNFQKKELPPVFPRDLTLPPTSKIMVIIGPRRSGKTFYLYQLMQALLSQGTPKEGLIHLNFESTRLSGVLYKDLPEIVELQGRLFHPPSKPILFLDEPQTVELWEKAVRSLYDEGFTIFLSGSSSKLLSKEIATSLRGRGLSYLLLPFSFREFLRAKGWPLPAPKLLSSTEKNQLLIFFQEYLEFGGFPEVALEHENETKLKTLESYFDLIVFKDLVERYHLKDSLLLRWFLKALFSSYSREVSIHKIYLTLKSQGRTVNKDDLYAYASMINDSFSVFTLPKFSWSIRRKELGGKIYLCDNGYINLIETIKETGKRIENLVFLELERRRKVGSTLSYWKNPQQEEVDFVLHDRDKVKQLIQVCYTLDDADTKKREIRALLKAQEDLHCKNLLVLTYDQEGEEEVEWFGLRGRVNYAPLWKWLLSEAKATPR